MTVKKKEKKKVHNASGKKKESKLKRVFLTQEL